MKTMGEAVEGILVAGLEGRRARADAFGSKFDGRDGVITNATVDEKGGIHLKVLLDGPDAFSPWAPLNEWRLI